MYNNPETDPYGLTTPRYSSFQNITGNETNDEPNAPTPTQQPPTAAQTIASQLQQLRTDIETLGGEQGGSTRDMFNRKSAAYMLGDVENWLSESNDRKQGKNALQQFGASMRGELKSPDTYTLGTFEAANNLNLLSLSRKAQHAQNDEGGANGLLPSEQLVLRAAALRSAAQKELNSQQTFAQTLGGGLVEALPYMGQFALTGGIGGAAATTARAASTRALAGMAAKGGAAAATANALPKVAGVAANVGARTLAQPSTYADIARRKEGDVIYTTDADGNIVYDGTAGELSWLSSINKGLAAGAINNGTEMLGMGIGRLGKQVNQRIINKLSPSLSTTLSTLPQGGFQGWATKLAERTGYNGMVQEFLEEQPATLLNALVVGDNSMSDLLDPQQQTLTALSAIAYGTAFKGLTLANQKGALELYKRNLDNSTKQLTHQLAVEGARPEYATFIVEGITSTKTLEELSDELNNLWGMRSKEMENPAVIERINDLAVRQARLLALERKSDFLQGVSTETPMVHTPSMDGTTNPYMPMFGMDGDMPTVRKNPDAKNNTRPPYVSHWEISDYMPYYDSKDNTPRVGESPSTMPLSMQQRRQVVQQMASKLRLDNVSIYDTQLDITDPSKQHLIKNGIGVRGIYSPTQDNLTMVLEHLPTERDIAITMLHEAVGHRGVINIFPDKTNALLTKVYNSMSDYDKIKYQKIYKSKDRAINEYVAHLAEGLIDSPTKWQSFCANFRNALRNKWLNLNLSENDIRFILRNVRDTSVEEGVNIQ